MLGEKDGMIWNECQAWMDDWDRGYRGERKVIMSPIQDILRWSWLQNTEMKTQQAVRPQAKKTLRSERRCGIWRYWYLHIDL